MKIPFRNSAFGENVANIVGKICSVTVHCYRKFLSECSKDVT
jgi:hypothetical protein